MIAAIRKIRPAFRPASERDGEAAFCGAPFVALDPHVCRARRPAGDPRAAVWKPDIGPVPQH